MELKGCVQKCPSPLIYIMSQINPVHTIPKDFGFARVLHYFVPLARLIQCKPSHSKIHFNIIFNLHLGHLLWQSNFNDGGDGTFRIRDTVHSFLIKSNSLYSSFRELESHFGPKDRFRNVRLTMRPTGDPFMWPVSCKHDK
jgi:hypothetical protein